MSDQTIQLGCCDADVGDAQRKAYLARVEQTARVPVREINDGLDKVTLKSYVPAARTMSVAELQRALTRLGFFPGGRADGICGYRTQSALRLFQEYQYAVEGRQDCIPDARFGPVSQGCLRDWLAADRRPRWADTVAAWQRGETGGEYAEWLALLNDVRRHHLAQPNRVLQMVNAYDRPTDTRKVADWDFPPQAIHLIGIRRHQFQQRSDDVLVLLIKGLVFKFQGSTEPGSSAKDASGKPLDPPFLVQGQHGYHFGWHRRSYLALRPLTLGRGGGVLVVRSKDYTLDASDLDRGLETNDTINVHWGGRGMNAVGGWSHGCQVISGSVYIDERGTLVDCGAYAANLPDEPTKLAHKTRGAYNVLLDRVVALGGDIGPRVDYMLLDESDLDLDPALKTTLDTARQRLCRLIA